MNEYVTDTHALLWYLYVPDRVGRAAQTAFVAADAGAARIYVPVLVIAETLMVAEKGRIPGVTIAIILPVIDQMRESANYRPSTLDPDMVLRSASLSSIPDIFDRIIATEALVRGVPLLSRDPVLRGTTGIVTIWD
jgi:PIN domain nuclease of toxin-antitoxin system